MIPSPVWENIKADAYERCHTLRSDDGMREMRAMTGIEWCDPGRPGKLPPTPPRRTNAAAKRTLPRCLRRQHDRLLDTWDRGQALEVVSVIHDALFEAKLTGENRLLIYLEHLYSCSYSWRVLQFISDVHAWLNGDQPRSDSELLAEALFAALVHAARTERACHRRATSRSQCRPLALRPRVAAHAPPE